MLLHTYTLNNITLCVLYHLEGYNSPPLFEFAPESAPKRHIDSALNSIMHSHRSAYVTCVTWDKTGHEILANYGTDQVWRCIKTIYTS